MFEDYVPEPRPVDGEYVRRFFWERVSKRGPTWGNHGRCWEWTGARTRSGYGMVMIHWMDYRIRAHRLSYELQVGPIPEGLQIDHLCRNRGCVRPSHLEPVPAEVNVQRAYEWRRLEQRKTRVTCPRGHKNRVRGGRVMCDRCDFERNREQALARKAKLTG